jgi:hypothetical protein
MPKPCYWLLSWLVRPTIAVVPGGDISGLKTR